MSTLFHVVNDKYDPDNFMKLKKYNCFVWLLVYLFSPLLLLWINIVIMLLPDEKNNLKTMPISGKKKMGYIYDMNLPEIKAYCKRNMCTVNDYCAALISVSLREFFELEATRVPNYHIPNSVRLALPFSFRQPFKKISEIKMINDFGCLLVDFFPSDNFDSSLK